MEVFILKRLRGRFMEVRILKGLEKELNVTGSSGQGERRPNEIRQREYGLALITAHTSTIVIACQ